MRIEALIYGNINSYTAAEFIESINETIEGQEEGTELLVRVNSDGGEVRYGWGMIAKFQEFTGKKIMKNDGAACSMAAFAFCYADDSESVDTGSFVFHRAAYPSWYESNKELCSQADMDNLKRINASLRKAFENKIDVPKFEAITDTTVAKLFSMEDRIDVTISAQDAKKIGLINRVIQITPKKKAEIEARMESIVSKTTGFKVAANLPEQKSKKIIMTITELKAEHPALYAQAVELGVTQGITQEKERIEAWSHFAEVDAKMVKEGIASGKPISQAQTFELMEKKFSAKATTDLEEDSTKEKLNTENKTVLTAEAKKQADLAAWKAEVLANSTILAPEAK